MCVRLCVRLRGCGHVCLKFLRLRAEHCTKWQPHQRDLHKRTFYDSAFQKNSVRSSKHTRGEAGCGWKVQRKKTKKNKGKTEDGRERKREGESERERNIKGKANPQKPFDISHQRPMLTCLTLHFQLSAKSSAWGCHFLHGRWTSRPATAFDRSHQFARVFFKGTHFPATCWGFLQEKGNVTLWFTVKYWWVVKMGTMLNAEGLPFCMPICYSARI